MSEHLLQQTLSLCPMCLRRIDAVYKKIDDESSAHSVDGGNRENGERYDSSVNNAFNGMVYLEKTCPQHGTFRVPAWKESPTLPPFTAWQRGRIPAYPAHPATEHNAGCPYDCGLCPEHTQHTCTGLLEITQRCNMRCPVCYAGAGASAGGEDKRRGGKGAEAKGTGGEAKEKDGRDEQAREVQTSKTEKAEKKIARDPSLEIIQTQLNALYAASGACNVQLSGGEPTVRNDLPVIIRMAKARGFKLVQVNSNGKRLAEEAGYAQELKNAGLDSVYLQWDGMTDDIFTVLRGEKCLEFKLAALKNCQAAGLGVVLVCTLVRGVNDAGVGDLLRFAVAQGAVVRGVHFQPVSSFGRFPWELSAAPRITLSELLELIEAQSGGELPAREFHAPACEHSLCSFSAVFERTGKHAGAKGEDSGKMGLSHALHAAPCCGGGASEKRLTAAPLDNAEGSRKAKAFVAEHWASPKNGNTEAVRSSENGGESTAQAARVTQTAQRGNFAEFLAASGAEQRFTISAMAFQDALSLDIARVRGCCIHIVTQRGKLIPFCMYNLTSLNGTTLYRGKED